MKYIVFIGSLKKGGAERNAALLSNYLIDNGHSVHLITIDNEVAFEINKKVQHTTLGKTVYKFRALKVLNIWFRLFKIVWITRPKRFITFSRIGGLLASLLFYPKTIVRFDIYPLIGYKKYKKWQFWFLYNMPWVKYVVCPSMELKNDVKRYFLDKKKLINIYNPGLVEEIKISKDDVHIENRPYIIVVSRLSKQKNVNDTIYAYAESESKFKYDLLILGDGTEYSTLKQIVNNLKLNDRIKFIGFVGNPFSYISNAKVLINSSMREGFPNILIESLSLNTPIISSDSKTGPKEIIFNGKNGYLFKVGDRSHLTKLIDKVCLDSKIYNQLESNVRMGLNRFSHKKVMDSWMKLL